MVVRRVVRARVEAELRRPWLAGRSAEPIYRGVKLRLSPAERRRITDLFASDPGAASEALLDLVAGGGGDEPTGGLGRHWSQDEQVARGFARPSSDVFAPGDDVEDARSLGVVLRGTRPADGEDPDLTNSGYEHTPLPGERLVSLLPGTGVEVDGLGLGNVSPTEGGDGWSYADREWHDLPARRRMRADRLYRGIPLDGEGDVDLDALAGGVGVHWSPRRDVAENFANWGSSEEDLAAFAAAGHPFRPVVVEAEWDGTGRDPDGVSGGMPLFDDDEVVLRPGTPLDVRSVRGRGGELLPVPRRMRASRRVAGLSFAVDPEAEGNWAYALDEGRPVSELCWDGDTGEVQWVQTDKSRRREGIGRELFRWVKENHQPDLRHGDELSESGRAFAEAVAALRVARASLRARR